jgi:hypothetical protein
MTDYSGLIEDLLVNGLGYGFQVADLTQRAAKALEAQAKEIAEKDARISSWEQDNEVLGQLLSAKVKDNEKLRARIAELAEALKPFADKANVFHDYVDDYPIMFGAEPPLRVVHLRAARAALKGERG